LLLCTFEGDSQTPKTYFVARILDVDITNNRFECEFVISQQRMSFQMDLSGVWPGVDVLDGTNYAIDTHDIYTPNQSSPVAEQVAVVTFEDDARYLCYVESITENTNIQFYHSPFSRMSVSFDNQIVFSDWDQYPAGYNIVSIEAAFLDNEIATPEPAILPDATAGWPPKPDFIRQYSEKEREAKFGKFRFVPAPSENGGDGISILDNWAEDNIIKVPIPQLASSNILNGSLDVPKSYTTTNSFIKFNKNGADQLQQLWQDWEVAGLLDRIQTFDGAFVARYIRKTQDRNPRPLSNHSWGTAFDINYEWNRLGKVPALYGQNGCVRELVALANKNGFFWGGHFGGGRIDGMHFELGHLI
jgi:hypothetical protein